MTIRSGSFGSVTTHFFHASYTGDMLDAGYYPIPYNNGTNGMIRSAIGVPTNTRLYVRRVSVKLIWASYTKTLSEHVTSFEIPFENHLESKSSLYGQSYMPILPVLHFPFVTVDNKKVVKQGITVQPSAIFYIMHDVLQAYFGVKSINFYLPDAKKGGYFRASYDIPLPTEQ